MRQIELRFLQLVFLISTFALLWVFYVQYILMIAPCKICLYQRIPHYSVLIFLVLSYLFESLRRYLMLIICFAFMVASILSFAQLGLEEKWFQFETSCSSNLAGISSFEEYRDKILNDDEIKCDYVAYRIMGFSLSFWNFIISISIFLISAILKLPRIFARFANEGK